MVSTSSQLSASRSPAITPADQSIITAAKGGGIAFIGHLFQQGIRLILGVLMARLLGAEQLGLCNLALTAATVAAGLTGLGLKPALVRYVSRSDGRRDTAGLWGALQIGIGLPTGIGVLAAIGLYALARPIADQLFHEPRLTPLLRMISLVIPFLALSNTAAAATRGFKQMKYTAIAKSISQPLIRLILIAILGLTIGLNAATALGVFTIAVIVASVMLLFFLNKLFSLRRSLREGRRNAKEMLAFALPVYLSDLVNTFGGNVKTLLLAALNTVTNVGVFAVARQVNTVGLMFHSSIATISAPIVSELYDQGEREQMGRFYQTMTKWTFTANLPFFLIVLLFPIPILSIFGQSFTAGAPALVILAWANLVNTGTGICGIVLDMTGHTSLKLVNSLVTFALTLGLSIWFIPRWGPMGAALSSLVTVTTVNLMRLLEVFFLFRLHPYNLGFIKPIAAGALTLGASWGISRLLPAGANLGFTVLNVVILLAMYAGLLLLFGLSQEDRAVWTRMTRHMSPVLSRWHPAAGE